MSQLASRNERPAFGAESRDLVDLTALDHARAPRVGKMTPEQNWGLFGLKGRVAVRTGTPSE